MNKLDFSQNERLNNFMGFVHKINSVIGEIHGKDKMFNLKPREDIKSFKVEDKKSKYNGREIVVNATTPSEELFSLASELVRPADEPFAAREIFAVDESFHQGSKEIGFDILAETGRAALTPTGNSNGQNIPKADVNIGRNFSPVGKISNYMEVSRDELQGVELRNDRGMGPLVDLISEKLTVARKNIFRIEDNIAFQGASFDDSQIANEIPGYFDSFSTNAADYEGDSPSKGKREEVNLDWTDAATTADQIIATIRTAAEYITRNGVYVPNTMALPRDVITTLGLRRTSDTDSTPILEWIKRAFEVAYGRELKIVGSNAFSKFGAGSNESGFSLLDSNKMHQAIAGVEALTVLPSFIDKEGTIQQVVLLKTGGNMIKHPGAAYLGTKIKGE